MSYEELGYNSNLVRVVNYPPMQDPLSAALNLPPKSIGIEKLVINKIGVKDYIASNDFIPSLSGWRIDGNGDSELNNVVARGTIIATLGSIGGFTIGANSLIAGSGATQVGLDTTSTAGDDIRIYAGSSNSSLAPFRVAESGAMTASNATITGVINATSGNFTGGIVIGENGHIRAGVSKFNDVIAYNDATTLYNSSAVTYGGSDSAGFFIGWDGGTYKLEVGDPGASRLSWDGDNLVVIPGVGSSIDGTYIQNATITGAKITNASITNAHIADASITNAKIVDATITSAKIYSLSADKITAGTLDAQLITVKNLNASYITSGVLTGRTVQTAATGARAYMDGASNTIVATDANNRRIVLNPNNRGLGYPGASIDFYDTTSLVASAFANSNALLFMRTFYDPYIKLAMDTGDIEITPAATRIVTLGGEAHISGDALVTGNLEVDGVTVSTGLLSTLNDVYAEGDVLANVDVYAGGDISCTGTKYFNIPHPTKPGKRLVYAATESGEVIISCRGTCATENEIRYPQHFIDVSEPGTIQCLIGKLRGSNLIAWSATAIRKGYRDYNCEQDSGDESKIASRFGKTSESIKMNRETKEL